MESIDDQLTAASALAKKERSKRYYQRHKAKVIAKVTEYKRKKRDLETPEERELRNARMRERRRLYMRRYNENNSERINEGRRRRRRQRKSDGPTEQAA